MITPATPIRGQGGNPLRDKVRAVEHAGQFLPPGMDAMTNTYLLELSRVCATEGLNYRVAVAQWDLETDRGRSPRWIAHRNPAGLGIEQDDDPDPATWTGEEAARVHAWALAHASDPTLFPPPGFLPTSADPFVRRWVDKYADPHCPIVRTVADLNRRYADRHGEMQATWAWDPDYPLKIVSRANAIFKGETMPTTLVFGNVTHPPFANRPIVKVEGVGQNDLGQRRVRGVTWHRMIGTLNGTDGWFRRPDVRALTDYGIGVMATDGPSLDGAIYRWNDPLGRQSGWASGVYSSAAYGDGAAFVAKYGVDAINRDRASIEISGNYDMPLSEASRDAIARLTAYWADQARIPWDVFPIVPEDGFSFICWHNEFGPDFGQKVCPGSVVMQETAALIERTRAILKAGQLVETVTLKPQPVYAAPALPDWWESSIAQLWPSDVREGDIRYRVMRRNFEAVADTIRRSAPNVRAAPSGPKLRAGEKVRGERLVEADRQWVLTNDGHYVLASKLTPDVRVRTRRAA